MCPNLFLRNQLNRSALLIFPGKTLPEEEEKNFAVHCLVSDNQANLDSTGIRKLIRMGLDIYPVLELESFGA